MIVQIYQPNLSEADLHAMIFQPDFFPQWYCHIATAGLPCLSLSINISLQYLDWNVKMQGKQHDVFAIEGLRGKKP